MASSREKTTLDDTVPPMHSQLICAFTPQSRTVKSEFVYKMAYSAEKKPNRKVLHTPPILAGVDMHAPVPVLATQRTRTSSTGSFKLFGGKKRGKVRCSRVGVFVELVASTGAKRIQLLLWLKASTWDPTACRADPVCSLTGFLLSW